VIGSGKPGAADSARWASNANPLYTELPKNVYNLTLSDWFNPPVIYHVERRGETIRIRVER
jgi:hypothetical protein